MLRFLCTAGLLWAAATLSPAARSAEGEPLRLRVLTYNIHHAAGVDGKLDVERIARVISAVEPDLVAVQEVDQKVMRSEQTDQPAELARLTGLHAAFGGNIPLQGGNYGNAVLSRFPIQRQQNHKLPSYDNGEQRGALEVEVELPGGAGNLTFLATHLDYRRPDEERLASAKVLLELPVQPLALLAGDLNATPDSPTLKALGSVWKVANGQPLPTIPVTKPARQIDFVLYRPASRWKTIEVRVLDEAVASDHRALLAVLEVVPK